METRVGIVERQESIKRELRAEVVVLARQHLLAHTSADLGGEVQNRAETQITTFATLVVLAMLDTPTTKDGIHTGVNVLVQVETLLRF